jgi:DNA-binding GntR family transcriptional regulator
MSDGWRGLAAYLRDRIQTGCLLPGDRLPAETTLMQESGQSRTTVRQAVSQLRLEGLVQTRHPKGTYVLGTDSPVPLRPGESVTAPAALTITRADGTTLTLAAGTRVIVTPA